MLLDETTVFEKLRQAGARHIPIQLIDDGLVRVIPAQVGLREFSFTDLKQIVSDSDLIEFGQGDSPSPGFMPISFAFADGQTGTVQLKQNDRPGCPASLMLLVNRIEAVGGRLIVSDDSFLAAVSSPDDSPDTPSLVKRSELVGVMIMPTIDLGELRKIALSERPYPLDLITVRAGCRVFNLDLPSKVLFDDIEVEEKQSFVSELILMRQRAQKTALVEGRVYFLNR